MPNSHTMRVKAELRKVGITAYSINKFTPRYLPKVIHDNEHIMAAVYGRYNKEETPFGFGGMLVATDRRVIFVDHKPGYTTLDELTYDVVSGVQATRAGLFRSITLYTKLGEFTVRFANTKSVKNFEHYVEKRRLEITTASQPKDTGQSSVQKATLTPNAQEFLLSHNIGVLSTIDEKGEIQSRTVYYSTDVTGHLYILTKTGTQQVRNLFTNQRVTLVSYDDITYQTIQVQGVGELENDPAKKQEVYHALTDVRDSQGNPRLIPITSFQGGVFVVIRITPTAINFTDFKQKLRSIK